MHHTNRSDRWTIGQRCAVIAAAVAIAACASTQTSMGTTGTSPGTLGVNSTVTVPALPTSDVQFLTGMSDANILQHMSTSDTMEIAMAQLARSRTQNAQVADFARQMIADHSMSLQRGKSIARQINTNLAMAAGDTSGMHGMMMLDSLRSQPSGQSFDQMYIRSQIMMHQHILAELETLQNVARDQNVRQHILADIPVVQQHLARAQNIGSSLGVSAGH